MISALAAFAAELAADPAVRAIVGQDANGLYRVRQIEPAGKLGTDPGDARGAGAYIAFVVCDLLDPSPIAHMGIRNGTMGIRAYAATYAKAEALWYACENVFLDKGAHRAPSGVGVYHSTIQAGGWPDHDPYPPTGTGQPLFHGLVHYPTTIAAVP
jgi:hypothetical protein